MGNSVGKLLVELGVNTAAFIEGMDKATYKAKAAAKQIGEAFEGMGSVVSQIFSHFGELGSVFGETFGQVGGVLSSVSAELGSLGGAAGAAAIGIGGLVAAGVAIEGAFIGLALHSAESAGELYRLSQTTGVSVEQLSTLGFAARQVGVSTETLARSLQLMSKQAFAAETAGASTSDAFSRLGIEVQDGNGHLKDAGSLFIETVGKLQNLGNEAEKVALSRKLFGRGGAELLPLINQGAAGIEELTQKARDLGLEVGTNTAHAAEEFEMQLRALKEGATGVGNQLLDVLMPIFKTVADSMVEGLKEVVAWTKAHAETIQTVTQYVASAGGLIVAIFKQVYAVITGVVNIVADLGIQFVETMKGIKNFSWTEVEQASVKAHDNMLKDIKGVVADSKAAWAGYATFLEKVFGDKAPDASGKPKGTGKVDTTSVDKVARGIQDQINKLRDQAEAELNLAAATDRTREAFSMLKDDEQTELLIKKLEAEAAKTTGAEHTKLVTIINKARDAMRAWTSERRIAAEGVKLNEALAAETDKINAQTTAILHQSDVKRAAGANTVDAQVQKALEGQAQTVDLLRRNLEELAKKQGVSTNELAKAQQAYVNAQIKLEGLTASTRAYIDAQLHDKAVDEEIALKQEADAFDILSAATLRSAAAQRMANAEVERSKALKSGASKETADMVYDNQLKKLDLAYQKTVATTAASFDYNKSLQDESDKMHDVARFAENYWAQQQKAYADQKISLGELQQAYKGYTQIQQNAAIALYESQNKIMKQWADQQIKYGDFTHKVAGMLENLKLEGENMWGSIGEAGMKALDGIANSFAKLLVTGKGSFKAIFQQFEESVLTSSVKKLESVAAGGIMKSLGLDKLLPGLAGKADGSEASPFFVKNADGGGLGGGLGSLFGGGGGDSGGEEGGGEGGGGIFGGLFGKLKGMFSGIGGFFGKMLGGIGHLFGGFMAGGGDVTPGKAYVVGEKHPEFFVPGKSGAIVPTMSTGGNHQTNLSVHFHGVTDADSFKKSQSQIASMFHRQASMAYQRNSQ